MQDTTNSLLSQEDTTFDMPTDDVKTQVAQLIQEGSQEAKDQLVQLGKDHGINVIPEMSFEEIKEQFAQAV